MNPVLRQEIASGSYCVDAERVAAAMITRMARERPSAVLVTPQPLDREAIGSDQLNSGTTFHEA